MKSRASIFTALALSAAINLGGASASPAQDRQEDLLNRAALAHAYGERCPAWKVNWMKYVLIMESAGIDINKLDKEPTFGRMIAAAERAEEKIKGLEQPQICKAAEEEFGPKGTLEANLMSDSLAVRGMNKLFELLD